MTGITLPPPHPRLMTNHLFDYCGSCTKLVARNILCKFCKCYFHVKCASINTKDFNTLKTNDSNWACFDCKTDIFPLMKANNDEFTEAFSDLNNVQFKKHSKCTDCSRRIKNNNPFITCQTCSTFFHKKCANNSSKNKKMGM